MVTAFAALGLAFALATDAPVRAAAGGKGGGGGGGDKTPKDVPGIAAFADLVLGGFEGDGAPYVDGQMAGWAHFVSNGNFTLRTYANGKKSVPRDLNVTFDPTILLNTQTAPGFMAFNDSGCPTGICAQFDDFVSGEGGLRDMGAGETKFVQINGRIQKGDGGDYVWRCGALRTSDGGVQWTETSYFQAQCTVHDGAVCTEWKVRPHDFDGDGSPDSSCAVLDEAPDGSQTRLPEGGTGNEVSLMDVDLTITRQ